MSISGSPSQAHSNAAVVAATAVNAEVNATSSSLSTVETVAANVSQSDAVRQVTEAATTGRRVLGQGRADAANAVVPEGPQPFAQRHFIQAAALGVQQGVAVFNFPAPPLAPSQEPEILLMRRGRIGMPGELTLPMLRPAASWSIFDNDLRSAVLECLPEAVQHILGRGDYFSDDGLRPAIGESPELLTALRDSVQGNDRARALIQCFLTYRHELDGVTPIHFSCNHPNALTLMIEIFDGNLDQLRKAILTCVNGQGVTPLYHAVERGNLPLLVDLFEGNLEDLREAMLKKGGTEHPNYALIDGVMGGNAAFDGDIKNLREAIKAMGGFYKETKVDYAPINCVNEYGATISAVIELFKSNPDTLISLCEGFLAAKGRDGALLFDVIGINNMLELAPELLTANDSRGRTIVHLLAKAERKVEADIESDLAIVLAKLKELVGASVKP